MKSNQILVLILLMSIGQLKAQAVNEDKAIVSKIKNFEMDHSQVMDILSYLSDIYGPRLTFSPEYSEAADWASKKFREWGLDNIHYDPWEPMGKGWTLKHFYAEVTSPRVIPLIAYPKAWSPGFDKPYTGDVIYLETSSVNDLEMYKGRIKGKFVLIDNPRKLDPHFISDADRFADSILLKMANAYPSPPRGRVRFPRMTIDNFDSVYATYRRMNPNADTTRMKRYLLRWLMGPKIIEFCKEESALAALSISPGDDGTIFVQQATVPEPANHGTMFPVNAYDAEAPEIIPQVVISSEQYNRMVRMIQKGEKVSLKMEFNVNWTKAVEGFNIIGEIQGTDLKNQIVMIGAHFDSWHSGTGATDNGTGSAVCMEVMRIFKELNLKTRRTIRIGLWGGEEQGLIGSREYVEETLAKNNINDSTTILKEGKESNLEKTTGYNNFSVYFNDDNGGDRFRGIYLQGNESARTVFRDWLHEFGDQEAQTLTISNTGGTEHLSFNAVGLPGFQFIQDPLDYDMRSHHSNMDVYERVPEEDLQQAASMMSFFVYKAATMD